MESKRLFPIWKTDPNTSQCPGLFLTEPTIPHQSPTPWYQTWPSRVESVIVQKALLRSALSTMVLWPCQVLQIMIQKTMMPNVMHKKLRRKVLLKLDHIENVQLKFYYIDELDFYKRLNEITRALLMIFKMFKNGNWWKLRFDLGLSPCTNKNTIHATR